MLRNVASQKWRVYAWDTTTGAAKTGDAANITAYTQKDDGTAAATNDTNPTEVSSSNQPGYYDFDMTQSETDGAKLSLSPKSGTSNVAVIACPPVVYTRPQYFSLLGIASDGDLSKVNLLDNLTIAASTTLATGTHNPQSGDAFSRIGSTGSGLTSLAPASTALSTAQWTNTRAGYLDNLSGGAVALASGVSVSSGGIISSSFASGAITATAIASDAFTAAKFASDVTTEFQSGLATASALSTLSGKVDTIDDFLDTEIAAILADTNELQTDWANGGRLDLILDARASQSSIDAIDGIVDDILVIAEKLDTALEDDGASGWQFTALALDNAPSGGGGGTDWTSDERTAIRAILGIPGSGTTPADPSTGILDSIRDAIAVVNGVADAILVDTAEIGAAGAGLTALAQASIWTSTIAGRIDAAVSTRASQTSVDDVPTNAEFAAAFPSNFAALGINASGHVSRVTLADTLTTYTSNTPQTGDAYARIGANGAGLTAIPWNASWDAEVQSEVTDALNAALTEGYRAAGSTGSVAQLLYEISAHLGRMAIAGTTKTLKKLDNSTTAKTFTLDDDTAPTAIEETT